jgi:chemotaxis protein MotB
MARKKRESHVNHERWLISYADFITLLFAFFVVMFASSQTDKAKAQAVSDSVEKALKGESFESLVSAVLGGSIDTKGQGSAQMKGPGGVKKEVKTVEVKRDGQIAELLPSLQILSQELGSEIRAGKLKISMGARGLIISFTQAALFPSGEDEIAKDFYPSVQKIANAIKKVPNPVRLEGHTDSVPIHNSWFKSNWDLSAARSIALLELFISFGMPADRLSIAGYADTAPVESNETEAGRQRNRRVDMVVLNETGVKGEPERMSEPAQQAEAARQAAESSEQSAENKHAATSNKPAAETKR